MLLKSLDRKNLRVTLTDKETEDRTKDSTNSFVGKENVGYGGGKDFYREDPQLIDIHFKTRSALHVLNSAEPQLACVGCGDHRVGPIASSVIAMGSINNGWKIMQEKSTREMTQQ